MQELLNIKELDKITENDKIGVFLYDEHCPSCEYFIPLVEEWEADIEEFKFYKISLQTYSKERKIHFEFEQFPALIIYRNGFRVDSLFGVADEVMFKSYFIEHNNNTWQSRDEIEQEQLDALDK